MANHKQFALLDGLRGFAALFILTRHTRPFWGGVDFHHSYLAVDLFFLMSGFVIGHAYDSRLRDGRMSRRAFFEARLIRLYPMFLMSLLPCVLGVALNIATGHGNGWTYATLATSALLTLAFLPSVASPANPTLFPLNGPYWSLFYELIVNLLYGTLVRWLSTPVMLALALCAAAAVLVCAQQHGNLDTGFQWGAWAALAGFSRALFGIFTGLLLLRHHACLVQGLSRHPALPLIALAAAIALLAAPSVPPNLDAWVDAGVVLLAFPVLVLLCSLEIPSSLHPVMLWLGSISYPVYVLHLAFGALTLLLVNRFAGAGMVQQFAPVSGIALVAVLAFGSGLLERHIDLPLRRALKRSADRWRQQYPE